MNYIFLCHDLNEIPKRFYAPGSILIPFNWKNDMRDEGKIHNIRRMVLETPTLPGDYFWMPDPDLEFPYELPSNLFAAAHNFNLDLCQPSLTQDSACSHEFVKTQGHSFPRQVEFCEVMCPVFSFACLKRNLWTFQANYSAYGIDVLWGKKEKCFVLDWITVRHPGPVRPPGAFSADYGFPDPAREFMEIKRLYL